MKKFTSVILILATLSACSDNREVREPYEADLIIENISIVDVTNGSVSDKSTVAILGDMIVYAGPADGLSVSEETARHDGDGGYIIPGLWDAHVHSVTNRSWHFPLMVSHGVTSVRNMHTSEDNPLERVQAIKDEVSNPDNHGPRFIANGALIDGPNARWPGSNIVSTPEEARALVDAQLEGGADFLKVYDSLPADAFFALAEHANEVGLPFDGHLASGVSPQQAAEAGQRTIEHTIAMVWCTPDSEELDAVVADLNSPHDSFESFQTAFISMLAFHANNRDPEWCQSVADALLEHNTTIVPTLVNVQSYTDGRPLLANEESLQLLPEATREEWLGMAGSELTAQLAEIGEDVTPSALLNTKFLQDEGVTLLAGTDLRNPFLIPGYHLLSELEYMVEAGLTPLEALQTATINPVRVFDIENSGQVMSGYEADMVILSANPLEDISNIRAISAVILDGAYLDRDALDTMQAEAAAFSLE